METNTKTGTPALPTRRSLLTRGGAVLGACLLPSVAGAANGSLQEPTGERSGTVFDVRKFGATGLRTDNATQAFRNAIDACTSTGGGVVNVPAGEYTVGTVQLTFLHVAGSNTKNIVVRNNLLAKAGKDITFENKALQKAVRKGSDTPNTYYEAYSSCYCSAGGIARMCSGRQNR